MTGYGGRRLLSMLRGEPLMTARKKIFTTAGQELPLPPQCGTRNKITNLAKKKKGGVEGVKTKGILA
jgi:hypothetical protein